MRNLGKLVGLSALLLIILFVNLYLLPANVIIDALFTLPVLFAAQRWPPREVVLVAVVVLVLYGVSTVATSYVVTQSLEVVVVTTVVLSLISCFGVLFARQRQEIATELAERRRVEVERERLRVEAEWNARRLADFFHLIAHDVNQPLTIVRGQLHLLRRAVERGDHQGAMTTTDAIDVTTRRLEALIHELVESAQMEMEQIPPAFELAEIEVVTFVEEFARRLTSSLTTGKVSVEAADRVVIYADPNRLERMLGNLLSNALKYSAPGSDVIIRVERHSEEALLAITDQGPGIAPGDQAHLFERGFRVSDAAERASGLGLGLYITRLLAEAHGGRVWVESEPGRGSTFYVALPTAA